MTRTVALSDWKPLGLVSPASLVSERLAAHWAAQIVAAAGATLCDPAPDASHTSLTWVESCLALAGVALEPTGCRAALRLPNLHLMVLDAHQKPLAELSLDRRTLDEGIDWLGAEVARARGAPRVELVRPVHELPDHPAGSGRPFAMERPSAYEELGRWYANAWRLLAGHASELPDAPPVRIWPHHFDAAYLVALSVPAGASEDSRSIGVGMSPGDASYPEPYWYVTPWPYPKDARPPPLEGGGFWHEEGWFGAVLRASALPPAEQSLDQPRRVDAFVRSAIAACRKVLG